MLKKHGLTYFNPQAVTRRLMPMYASAIDNSRVLLFVIQGNSRSVGAMNEAAFHIGKGHKVVLGMILHKKSLTGGAIRSYLLMKGFVVGTMLYSVCFLFVNLM